MRDNMSHPLDLRHTSLYNIVHARKGYGAAMKKDTIDKLIDRIDHIKEEDLQRFFVKLAEQQGFFQQVFESIQEGLILLDSKGKILFVNQAALKLFDKEPEHITPEDFCIFLGRDCSWNTVQQSHTAVSRDVEIFYPEHKFLNIFISPIGNKSQGHLILIRDETPQQKRNAENIEAERLNALTLLAAGVAHEIGNPAPCPEGEKTAAGIPERL